MKTLSQLTGYILSAALLLPFATLHAQTLTWDGATNNNWSNGAADVNWTGNPWSPGANAVFPASGSPATYNITLTNDITAGNILLSNDLLNGVTVTLGGAQGLTVSGANLNLGPFRPNNVAGIGQTTLNMGGLDSFTFNSPAHIFRVGLQPGTQGAHAAGTTVSTVTLADTNTITASQLLMGDVPANSGGGRSVLQLGRSNSINANIIDIAATGRSNALLQFDPNVAGATATFRATDGTSPVTSWNIGAVRNFTNNTWSPIVDLSGGTIDALVATMTIGDANTVGQATRVGTSDATFTMGGGTFTSSTLNIGRVTGAGSIGAGFRGAGTFNINGAAAQFTAGTINLATMNHTATGGSNISTRGLFNLENGAATITGGIVLGSNTTTGNTGTVDAVLRQNAGTLSISGGVIQGSEASGPVTSNIQLLGGTSTIGGGITTDTIRVGYNGRSATATATNGIINIGNGSSTALIGHKETSGSATSGTLNLQNTSSVTMDLAALDIAYHQGGTSATVLGTLNLSSSGPNSITASLIRLGQIDGGSTGNTTGTLNLGLNNTINADTFIVGGDKATGIVTTPANSTITIAGKAGPAANLIIGANNGGNTGTSPTASHFDMGSTLGTTTNLNATIDNLVIGQYLGTGIGSGRGILTMNGGTLVANNVNLAQTNGSNPLDTTANITVNNGNFTVLGSITDGAGTSSIIAGGNTSGTGNFTVGNGMAVDNFRVANNGRTAIATVLAGDVRIGSGTGTNSFVGYRINSGSTTTGTLNLAATDNVLIDAGTFTVAYNEGASGSAAVNGTLLLSQNGTNTVIADLFRIGQIDGAAVGNTIGTVQLGLDNTFQTDLLIVGAEKSRGTMTLAPGGTLALGGKSAAGGDLFIGANNTNTSLNPAVSHLDTSGGTFNATIDNLQIGTYGGTTNSGSGKGLLTMAAGTVTANHVLLAQTSGPNLAGTQGTLALNGGTFIAGSIASGNGVASFQFNGGNLSFATFGTGATPFALNNTGTGTLNPGVDTSAPQVAATLFGTSMVHGAYSQGSSATLAFDLSLDSGADLLVVDGPVTLAGNLDLLTHGAYPGSLQSFTLISNLSGNPVSGTFNGLAEGDTVVLNFGGIDVPYFISYQGGASGQDVVLSVPEPARALLLLLASTPLLLRRRRDR